MTFADLQAAAQHRGHEPEPLTLQFRGELYEFPAVPDAVVAARMRLVEANRYAAAAGVRGYAGVADLKPWLVDRLLGEQRFRLAANGVGQEHWVRIATTLILFYVDGPVLARRFWDGGLDGVRTSPDPPR